MKFYGGMLDDTHGIIDAGPFSGLLCLYDTVTKIHLTAMLMYNYQMSITKTLRGQVILYAQVS